MALTDPIELFAEQMYVSFETAVMESCFSWLISLLSLTVSPLYQVILGGGFPNTWQVIRLAVPTDTVIVDSLRVGNGGSIT